MSAYTHHPSSYRDPSGFILTKDGVIYRQVNKVYKDDFELMTSSGCYQELVQKELLLPFTTIRENLTGEEQWYSTIQPEQLDFISYPYEWCFDMLKDAALLTLTILKTSLNFGLILKDATPYNIQWHKGKLIFIDCLSFEKYNEAEPWIAYRQFCEQFLSPLLLSHYSKEPLQELLLAYSDGIPLAVTSKLLPKRTRFSLHTYLHIHLNAKYSGKGQSQDQRKKINFSRQKLLNLVNSLEELINKLKLPAFDSTWSNYYEEADQREDYMARKQEIVGQWLQQIKPASVADLGANTGEFAKLAAKDSSVIAADLDPFCINTLYQEIKSTRNPNILPIINDLSHPSPAIGLNNEERDSLLDRMKVDMVLALALIHHLAIGKNIPMIKFATLLQGMCKHLIIEFVPKIDPKVQFMLKNKKDIYTNYTEQSFIEAFQHYFTVKSRESVGTSGRTLFLMERI